MMRRPAPAGDGRARAGGAVGGDEGGRDGGQQQRLVADQPGVVPGRVHAVHAPGPAAVAAREEGRAAAGEAAPRSSASVVLPAPPTVALPQQITGTGARQPGRASRRAVAAA